MTVESQLIGKMHRAATVAMRQAKAGIAELVEQPLTAQYQTRKKLNEF
jgi:hypothetical protein